MNQLNKKGFEDKAPHKNKSQLVEDAYQMGKVNGDLAKKLECEVKGSELK